MRPSSFDADGPWFGRRLWRPPATRAWVLGLVLAAGLSAFAAWLVIDLAAFDRFPGLPFLAAAVVATLVGRFSAGILATVVSSALISIYGLPPDRTFDIGRFQDVLGLLLFAGVSFVVAYTLALKDVATDEVDERGSEVEGLARQLAAERNTVQAVLQQMPSGVMVADVEGRLTLANTRAIEILGYRYEIGRALDDVDRDAPRIAQLEDGHSYSSDDYPILRALRTGEVVMGEMMVVDHVDGSRVVIQVDAAPIRMSPNDEIAGAVTAFQDVTEQIETQQRLAQTRTRLVQLQSVTDAALSGLSFDDLAERTLQKVRQALGTDSATLLLVDRTGSELIEHGTVGVETEGPSMTIPIGQGIAGTIASAAAPLVVDDISTYRAVRPWLTRTMHSLMGVPLMYRGQVRGVIHVATRAYRHFEPEEVEVLELAANRIASALERASLYDDRSAMSQALQRSLLPARIPPIDGADVAALYRAFSPNDEVGGDFYDVFPYRDQAWGLVIGDVSGKGPDAAAIMGFAAHSLRAFARYETQPSAVLDSLNDSLLAAERVSIERFCTVCQMRLRPEADRLSVTVCLAGHPLPWVVRCDRRVEQVGTPGTLLGSFADPVLHDDVIDLMPGEALVAYTDGLIERAGVDTDEGERRLAELLTTCVGLPADQIVARIDAELLQRASLDDDVAVVVIAKP